MRRLLLLALLATPVSGSAQVACPGTATLTIFVENLSGVPSLGVTVDGELPDLSSTCSGSGAAAYHQTMTCTGQGVVRCDGAVTGLRPGSWIHRITTSVPDSDRQQQARRFGLVAGDPADVSNTLLWTVYPRTYVVANTNPDDSDGSLRTQLAAAADYTAANPGPALVTFAPDAFPGVIDLSIHACAPEPSRHAALCFADSAGVAASRVVVDGLGPDAKPGVVWSVGTRALSVLRVYGSDNVFRGIVFDGSRSPAPPTQLDVVALTGPGALRNRIEQSIVLGPTGGDAVSVDMGATGNVILDSEMTRAADRGVKIDAGAATVARSCVHDNQDGGVLTTSGGQAVATENVVQRNPGSKNGVTVRGTDAATSRLRAQGNVIRFHGTRGVTVTDNAEAWLDDDYIADNTAKGSVVESQADVPSLAGVELAPAAHFHGVALVCNGDASNGAHGAGTWAAPCTKCDDPNICSTCVTDAVCAAVGKCVPTPADLCTPVTCYHQDPSVTYGDETQPGQNAFTTNRPANFRVDGIGTVIPAGGNEWEHCPTGPPCDVTQDISPSAAPVDVGTVLDPRTPVGFHIARVSPPRPRAGDVVRVYGGVFDAINGNPAAGHCFSPLPGCTTDADCTTGPCRDGTCACAVANAAVQQRNSQTQANRLRIESQDGSTLVTLYPDAVTPTMLVFTMPFDCFAPLTLEVAKRDPSGGRTLDAVPLCDPTGCAGQPSGAPCDDGNGCTMDDLCDGNGRCEGRTPLVCDGPCLTCNSQVGCVPSLASSPCSDGNPCTQGDHCSGTGNTCLPGAPALCTGPCQTGVCDPQQGCAPKSAGIVCRAVEGPCDAEETCNGISSECPLDRFRGQETVCRPAAGPCDQAEACAGNSAACPTDGFSPPTTVCRPAVGVCDVADTCAGTSVTCPADAKSRAVCRPAVDVCDVPERCDGVHDDCPPDALFTTSHQCRAFVGPCDLPENCTGTDAACPADLKSTDVCGASGDACDAEARCDGVSNACPPNPAKPEPDATTCAFERPLPDKCIGKPAVKPIWHLFQRAGGPVTRAEVTPGGARCRLFRRARTFLKRAENRIDRAVNRPRPRLSPPCGDAMLGLIGDAVHRIRTHLECPS